MDYFQGMMGMAGGMPGMGMGAYGMQGMQGMPGGMGAAAGMPGLGAAAGMMPGAALPAAMDEVRTVFITGFPTDVKERELNNLLRFVSGYEASQMHWKNGQAQGFALFITAAAARAACDQIAGLCFDDNVVLRAEMAHKNMYIKGEAAPAPVAPTLGKRVRTVGGFSGSYSGGGSAGGAVVGPVGYAPVSNTRDNPPCNTLFIGNLGESADDNELQVLFGTQPGFSQIKVLRSNRNVSCFVEFESVETAAMCHATQQGAVLRSSDRGGIRIQFSKNPFGKKRDASGQLVDARGSSAGGGLDGMQSASFDGVALATQPGPVVDASFGM